MLHPGQQRIKRWLESKHKQISVLNCARQFGKSFLMVALCVEYCLKNPNSQVRYASPATNQTENIVIPNLNRLFATCPPQLRPNKRGSLWEFHNGSQLHITGVDKDQGERLRGSYSHLIVLDECGFMSNLEYIVQSVCLPQFVTTGGQLIMVSTPPVSKQHPFTHRYIANAIKEDAFATATYLENPNMTPETLKLLVDSYEGGMENLHFRREYLADYTITDQESRVVPEYKKDEQDRFMQTYMPPEVFQPYVGMDPAYAGRDYTAILFGHYNYPAGTLVIDAETVIRQANTRDMALAIKNMEHDLWGKRAPGLPPLPEPIRIIDNANPLILNDLRTEHQLLFTPVTKTTREEMLNSLRVRIADGTIRVNTRRCPVLNNELADGVWNKKGNDYARSEQDSHLDTIDALKYLSMRVRWYEDPYTRLPDAWARGRGASYIKYKPRMQNILPRYNG